MVAGFKLIQVGIVRATNGRNIATSRPLQVFAVLILNSKPWIQAEGSSSNAPELVDVAENVVLQGKASLRMTTSNNREVLYIRKRSYTAKIIQSIIANAWRSRIRLTSGVWVKYVM
jgi:hypothetical protein